MQGRYSDSLGRMDKLSGGLRRNKVLYDFKKDRNEYKFHPFFWQVGGKYVYPQDADKIYYHHRRGFEDCFEQPQNIPFRSCL